ncbi:MAG: DUF1822 family protein [Heteroscytonema crispum UTEX LB 1556]
MTRVTDELEDFSLTLPIAQIARQIAQQFAQGQPTPEKAEQVQLNTLSVLVVNDYLQMMGIATNVLKSDSWNPVVRLCANVADLEVRGIGRLECRPVRMHEMRCYVPPETWEERAGYVFVQVDESLQEAKLLGFVRHVTTEELPLNQLQPPEALIEHLAQLQQLVKLSQWVTGIFETGWQTLESLWNQLELTQAYAFRGSESVEASVPNETEFIRRAKLIDLGIQIANQPVMLIVELSPQRNEQTSIRLQLHPASNQIYLPPEVKLTVLDDTGAVFLSAQARSADNYIQLQLRGEPGEKFSVRVALNDTSITEHFVI